MRLKKTSTNNMFDFKLFNFFDLSEDDVLFLDDHISPDIILFFDIFFNMNFTIVYLKSNPYCSVCGSKLNKNGKDNFKLNKHRIIKKQKYVCSNKKCKHYERVSLEKYIDKYCNYTRSLREWSLNIGLIDYISYYRKSELLETITGIQIPRSTVYYHENILSDTFLTSKEKQVEQMIQEAQIEPSGYYHYDEQYIKINKELHMRMTLLDSITNQIINEKIVNKKEFTKNTIETFLKKSLKNLKINTIITDGNKSYPTIIESVGAIQQRCTFHIMQTLMNNIFKETNPYKRQNKNNKIKIKEKEEKIELLKTKYKKKKGRISQNDTKTQKYIKRIQKLKKEIKQLKDTTRENKKKIKEITKYKNKISLIFKSKTLKTANKRFQKLKDTIQQQPPVIATFIKKITPHYPYMINHILDNNIKKTNSKLEGYYKTTLPRHQKKIYRTQKGIKNKLRQTNIRWTIRNTLKQKNNTIQQQILTKK